MDKRVKLNYLYSVAYQALTIITPLITIPYLSRVFGAEYLGIYSYTNTIAQYFVIFAMLGLANYGNRSIAMVRDDQAELNRTFSEIYCMQLISGFASFALYIIYVVFFMHEYKLYMYILSLYVFSAIIDINWLYFGLEKFKMTVTRNSIIKLISVLAILTLVKSKEDLWLYSAIYALSTLCSTGVLWICVKKEVSFVKPTREGIYKHLKPNIVMFIPVIAISVYKYMDKLMLGNCSKIEVGYYENVEKIYTVIMGFVTAFGTVMLPRMSNEASQKGINGVKNTIASSMRFVLGLSFGMAFGLAAISSDFVCVFFGPGFEPCIKIMIALTPTLIFQSWANVVRTQFLIPFKRDNVYVASVIAGAIINFLINYLLISMLGAMGAVFGTVVAEVVVAMIQTIWSRKELNYHRYLFEGIPFVFIGLLLYIIVRIIGLLSSNEILKLVLEIIVGGGIYLINWMLYEIVLKRRKRDN